MALLKAVNTHLEIDHGLCGSPTATDEGTATVELVTTANMAADARGLVHGGFVFGLVDHAAMLAVNDPFVVLGAADVRLTAPVTVGDKVVATASLTEDKGNKRVLAVSAKVGDVEVMKGTMTAFVLKDHVLDQVR